MQLHYDGSMWLEFVSTTSLNEEINENEHMSFIMN
jgi:hypothetical protein